MWTGAPLAKNEAHAIRLLQRGAPQRPGKVGSTDYHTMVAPFTIISPRGPQSPPYRISREISAAKAQPLKTAAGLPPVNCHRKWRSLAAAYRVIPRDANPNLAWEAINAATCAIAACDQNAYDALLGTGGANSPSSVIGD